MQYICLLNTFSFRENFFYSAHVRKQSCKIEISNMTSQPILHEQRWEKLKLCYEAYHLGLHGESTHLGVAKG